MISFSAAIHREPGFVRVYSETWSEANARAVAAALRDAAKVCPVTNRRVRKCGALTVSVDARVHVAMANGSPLYGGIEWALRFADALDGGGQ